MHIPSLPLDSLLERFLRYVQIDTQSADSAASIPSTAGQWELLRLLQSELLSLGLNDVELNSQGFLFAVLPANSAKTSVEPLGFLAHVDTAPDFTAVAVKPLVHRNYDGGVIRLPTSGLCLDPEKLPQLKAKQGETIITSSGDTLLGADDKAGVAVLMTLIHVLRQHPEIPHPELRFCFTPDEEVGAGIRSLDMKKFSVRYAFTIDSESPGDLCFETFSADLAKIQIEGVAIHPGRAKGAMVNALQLAARLIEWLCARGDLPELTAARQGYLHPHRISGSAATIEMAVAIRDFELSGLQERRIFIESCCQRLMQEEPRARVTCTFSEQYRNMRYWLEKDMRPVEIAKRAIEAVGLVPNVRSSRGGTDGSLLTEMGILTPNIFAGMHNIHGPLEWTSLEEMAWSVRTLVALVQHWEAEFSA